MVQKKLDPPLNVKTILVTVMGAALLVGAFLGGRVAIQHFQQTPWYIRYDVRAYLKKQSGRSNLKSDFDLDAKQSVSRLQAELAALKDKIAALDATVATLSAAGAAKQKERDEKRAEANKLRKEMLDRQRELALKEKDATSLPAALTRVFQAKMAKAGPYSAMYGVIGEQVWLADQLFESPETEKRRLAFQAAAEASRHAFQAAENLVLSARIIEGWLLPNLAAADPPGQAQPAADQVLKDLHGCVQAYQSIELTNEMLRVAQLLIDHTSSPKFADDQRLFIAGEFELRKEYAEAIRYLRQVTHSGYLAQTTQRIAVLQAKLDTLTTNTAAKPPKKP